MSLTVKSTEQTDIVDVTDEVAAEIPSDVTRGVCTVFVQHTTAGVVVQEPESRLLSDIEAALARIVPDSEQYSHDEIDDNAAAHLRAMLLGESVTIPVVDGDLDLGRWQSILFVECDGPRTRSVQLTTTRASGD